jgi:hypothetical protein
MSDLFWDVRSSGAASAGDAGMGARRAETAVEELESRIDRLSMICCAMWTIIQAHTDVSDEELVRLVQELDLSDGFLDGKAVTKQVRECATCGRPVANKHQRCLYCGAPRNRTNPFDSVL